MWRVCVLGFLACSTGGCDQIFGLNKTSVVDAAVGGSCSGSATCEGTTVCDTDTNTCVQCTATQTENCTGDVPLCGSDNTCHGCAQHSDCPSDVCFETGACGDADDIAYVTSTGSDTNACTQAAPCATINAALAKGKPTIKVRGSINASTTISDSTAVAIIGDTDAQLHGVGAATIAIDGNANVTLRDLLIASGSNGVDMADGGSPTVTIIHCQLSDNVGAGLRVANSGSPTLTLAQSKLENNVGGGVSIAMTGGAFQIVGNSFYANGGTGGGLVGGASISGVNLTASRLDLNTFADNRAADPNPPGLYCDVQLTASSNIVADNFTGAGSDTSIPQVSGGCTYDYTLSFPSTLAGSDNMSQDPEFENLATGDLRFGSDSPAASSADPHANLSGIAAMDPDGQARTAPADRGAFEHIH